MKKLDYKVEYLTEYAKDLVYSKDFYRLKDQTYILAKQHHPIFKLNEELDFLVNDGPFLLGLIYAQDKDGFPIEEFKEFLLKLWKKYKHKNYFLIRNPDLEYQEFGREQSLEESLKLADELKKMFIIYDIPFTEVLAGKDAVKTILEDLKIGV